MSKHDFQVAATEVLDKLPGGSSHIEGRYVLAKRIELFTAAPDFSLEDVDGRTVRLSDYRGTKHVVLVFNRGFV
jgi:AhpC/TSA family protein